ncbi:hypothetical protein CcaverHIS002_0105640 [Cutaneotrichosporon cavernicola]|uniref:Uncharacterized protein n=1 Tax=Cutaneotrichosporon cavernicola TaxID=279322 RepID=A0AA48IBL4_9TREE|nr:uncharacterized protein CcaverHIS019_0105590 [Cutaneotrichosporon cavernicola]BEI80035.1 hypothetical protein CcaverHIS002_0105640 [Cutaneotrichosporon cavernicola]BEI87841.1 hypothetical protein CcaverHIS019_0105590 [Cutaneotrichosporon cavernicola]BEI95615.1 hypothetical protein CcaverHIS631_0105640 [Cutaneotrichosporon cavernicola]BEJ03390.1 hypothetical protein CcaverHIS641_0105650 [Cutaneotrichosporon cavernicola]
MLATRRLLRAPKGVPGWAQHMAKQPSKTGRLPPQQWANAPDKTPESEDKVPPTDWKAAGSEARAWEDIKRPDTQVPEGARPVPPQQGPYAPKTDRSKGFMDSFRSLSPNQRILIGATLFIFGLGVIAYDSVIQKEEEVEIQDDLRERLAKASAIAKTAASEGVQVDTTSVKDALSKAAETEAETIRAATKAVETAAERTAGRVLEEVVEDKERVVGAVVQAVHAAHDKASGAAEQVQETVGAAAQHAKKHVDAAGQAIADTINDAASDENVVNGTVPERTSVFGIRLR